MIVEDDVLIGLPKIVRESALSETKQVFAFIPRFQVVTRPPAQFPTTFDFTDCVCKVCKDEEDVNANLNDSYRRQMANILFSIKQNHMRPASDPIGRFTAVPEKGGTSFSTKEIKLVGRDKLAWVVMLGAASLEFAQQVIVTEELADGRDKQDILDDQRRAMQKGLERYSASAQSLRETRELAAYDLMNKSLAGWDHDIQDHVGIVLGRIIAHEARHQYITPIEKHAATGLGADSPSLWGDKNFERFSGDDQRDLLTAIQRLEALQNTATIRLETNPNGQPFPF